MRQSVIAAIVVALAAALAPADTIYLRNGQTHQGKATPIKGDKMLIETAMGSFEVAASDVIQVVPSSMPADATGAPAAVERAVIPVENRRTLSIDQMTNPEPVIFTLMRNLAVMAPGTETYNLRQQIEQWRATAHDRKRKAQFEWVLPEEFARRRQLYIRTLKEAEDLERKIRPASRPAPNVDPNVDRKKAMIPVLEKFDSAARGWADPLIRDFLTGISAYDREDYGQSESLFRKCIEAEPLIAAFHQGRAANLMEKNHPLWGLEELLAALELRPDGRELLSEIQAAMKKVPGTSIKDPLYLEAQKVLGLYADTDKRVNVSATATPTWFMPGREWQVRGESLPTPPYDRLIFRQAVGVPIGTNTLLVDISVVKDSLECYVRIDANTVAPAWFKKVSTSGRAPALATLTVPGFEFTVPRIIEDGNAIPGEAPMAAHAVPSYAEMGSLIRKATGKLGGAASDGSVVVSGTLIAGEAAAPVFVGEGTLIGFLAGKTDVGADNGGPDRFIPMGQFIQVLRQLKTAVPDQSTYGRMKRTPAVRPAPGDSFLVTAIVAETLE
jgi:hypothetical protein